MRTRSMTAMLMAFALASLFAMLAMAADSIHGKIESAGAGNISIMDNYGTRQAFAVESGAKITLDGKKVALEELPQGASVDVMMETKNDKSMAVMITAESPL